MGNAKLRREERLVSPLGDELLECAHGPDDSGACKSLQASRVASSPDVRNRIEMKENLTTFGGRLRAARKKSHLSQMAAGSLIGVTHGAIGQWEREETVPEAERLIAIAELYECSIDWLIWGRDVSSGVEQRIRKIHPVLRAGLIQRLHAEIDETEKAQQRMPEQLLAAPVKDNDTRLIPWNASRRRRVSRNDAGNLPSKDDGQQGS